MNVECTASQLRFHSPLVWGFFLRIESGAKVRYERLKSARGVDQVTHWKSVPP